MFSVMTGVFEITLSSLCLLSNLTRPGSLPNPLLPFNGLTFSSVLFFPSAAFSTLFVFSSYPYRFDMPI